MLGPQQTDALFSVLSVVALEPRMKAGDFRALDTDGHKVVSARCAGIATHADDGSWLWAAAVPGLEAGGVPVVPPIGEEFSHLLEREAAITLAERGAEASGADMVVQHELDGAVMFLALFDVDFGAPEEVVAAVKSWLSEGVMRCMAGLSVEPEAASAELLVLAERAQLMARVAFGSESFGDELVGWSLRLQELAEAPSWERSRIERAVGSLVSEIG